MKGLSMRKMMVMLLLMASVPAHAEGLTVEQCISILTGLNALNCVGQQLGGQCPADVKQYKLGEARYTIAMAIAGLGPILNAVQEAQRKYIAELGPLPPAPAEGKVSAEYNEAVNKQNKLVGANQVALLAKPCNVQPGHLKLSELHLGDGTDQNPIPPSVLAAFAPIVDK
jgi:hypothetical protein